MRRFLGIIVAVAAAFSLAILFGAAYIGSWPWSEGVIKLVR